MAKKKKAEFDAQAYERQHLLQVELYVNQVGAIYDNLAVELANLAASIPNIKPENIFTFDDYPGVKQRLKIILDRTTLSVTNSIDRNITDAWLKSNIKNDALVESVVANTRLPKSKVARYMQRNLEALAQTRTPAAELSKNVYKITKQFQRIAEYGIEAGIGKGTGSRQLATDIRKALKDPEFTFRRVRNEKGELKWSKSFQKFRAENPGQTTAAGRGVYINPQRNYERLTRTETNRSYRKADQVRYDQLDFVVGVRINLSNNPNHCKMCEALKGDYPKNFVWSGWHPQCRCYKTSILKTDSEIERDNIRIINGQEPLKSSVNLVKKMPGNFDTWVADNKERLQAAIKRDQRPYWIRDAYKDGDFSKGVNLKR